MPNFGFEDPVLAESGIILANREEAGFPPLAMAHALMAGGYALWHYQHMALQLGRMWDHRLYQALRTPRPGDLVLNVKRYLSAGAPPQVCYGVLRAWVTLVRYPAGYKGVEAEAYEIPGCRVETLSGEEDWEGGPGDVIRLLRTQAEFHEIVRESPTLRLTLPKA